MGNSRPKAIPDLAALLYNHKVDVVKNLNCIQIGTIESFDAATQVAQISFVLKQVKEILPDGTEILQSRPVLAQVPCIVLFGGVGFLSMPIAKGDNCLLFFNDREFDNWFISGEVSTPSSSRMHDISDAIALVGINSLQTVIENYLNNGVRLSYGGSDNARIDLQDNAINSLAALWTHIGSMAIQGNLSVSGIMTGNAGTGDMVIDSNVTLTAGKELHDGRGVTGTFNTVTVEDGIVTGGT